MNSLNTRATGHLELYQHERPASGGDGRYPGSAGATGGKVIFALSLNSLDVGTNCSGRDDAP